MTIGVNLRLIPCKVQKQQKKTMEIHNLVDLMQFTLALEHNL